MSKFDEVYGDNSPRVKIKQLEKMEDEYRFRWDKTPRKDFAIYVAMLALLLCCIFYAFVLKINLYADSKSFYLYFLVLPFSCGYATYLLSNKPKKLTWRDRIDRMLCEYNPIDKERYLALQKSTVENGFLLEEDFDRWLASEKFAVVHQINKYKGDKRHYSFTEKNVFTNENSIENKYYVERGGHRSPNVATQIEVEDFLDACGIERECQTWLAALAGVPIEIDDSVMRFVLTKDNITDDKNDLGSSEIEIILNQASPFQFNISRDDVGHSVIFAPARTGMSCMGNYTLSQ